MNKSWCKDLNQNIDIHLEELSNIEPELIPTRILHNYNNSQLKRLISFLESQAIIASSPKIIQKKVLIISNNTYDILYQHIKLACLQKNIFLQIEDLGYADPIPCIINMHKNGDLNSFDYVLINLDEDYFFEFPNTSSESKVELETAIEKLHQVKSLIEEYVPKVTIILQTIIHKMPPTSLHYQDVGNNSIHENVNLFNKELIKCRSECCIILDLRYSGISKDLKYHYFGKLPFNSEDFTIYSDLFASLIFAHLGLTKKVLILDLDNTLWGGVIGDDGLDGIRIKIGDPIGEAYIDFQKYCKSLLQMGVILCVCSKNNLKIAQEPFKKIDNMPLSLSDFIVFKANWKNKALNLEEIALTLNLGLDSFVFVDDNPAEREIIRQKLPMVSVPEIGSDPSLYSKIISDAGYFSSIRFSDSDKNRVQDYKANIVREKLKKKSVNLDDYLESLQMIADQVFVNKENVQRASQMTLKTNQFNTNLVRLNEKEINQMIANKEYTLLQYSLKDKFADNGIVSLVILKENNKSMEIVNWVMSCRVFERTFENYIFNNIIHLMQIKKLNKISASIIENNKNVYIHNLYEKLGLKLVKVDKNIKYYENDLINLFQSKSHIQEFSSL